jgi:hypothetical protein
MSDDAPGVLEATAEVVEVSFDLVGAEISLLPEHLPKAINSPQVQAAIKKTLLDFAQTRSTKADTVVSGPDAQKFIEKLAQDSGKAALDSLGQQVARTEAYKRLEASLKAFEKAASSSGIGVWVSENGTLLKVVGAMLIVGSGTVLYVTKTGGAMLNAAMSPIEGKQFQVLAIGALKFNAGVWDFQPDARIFGARVGASARWSKVEIDLKLGVLAEGPVIQQVEGAAVLKSGPIALNLTAGAKPQTNVVNLALRVDYQINDRVNIGVGTFYKVPEAEKGHQGYFDDRPQYGGMLTVTIPFGGGRKD